MTPLLIDKPLLYSLVLREDCGGGHMEEPDDTRLEPTGKHWETGMPRYCTANVTRSVEIKQLHQGFERRENVRI